VGRLIRRELPASAANNAGAGADQRPAFSYRDKGNMATIGRSSAVADVAGWSFGGLFAWLLWSGVHIAFLIGFRSKLLVMVNWAWQWLFQARGARLITGSPEIEVKQARDLSRHAEP